MNDWFSYLPFNLIADLNNKNLKYLIIIGLLLDLIIYQLPFINTILFIIIYFINTKFKYSHNILIFIFKNYFNLTLGLIFYIIYTNNLIIIKNIWISYISSTIISIIIYIFRKQKIEIKKV